MKVKTISLMIVAMSLLLAGCSTSLKAEPTSFTFENISWEVISAKFENKFGCPTGFAGTYRTVEPNSTSETLLVVEFGTARDFGLTPPSSLLNSLSKVALKDTLQKPLCYTAAKPITGSNQNYGFTVTYVFSVPKEMGSVEIVLPDKQIISITK
jgi:hypothetical protein